MKLRLDTFLAIPLFFVVFFMVLDGLRDTFYPGYFPVSFLRDISVLSFFFGAIIFYAFSKEPFLPIRVKPIFLAFVVVVTFLLTMSLITTLALENVGVFSRADTIGGGLGFWAKFLTYLILSMGFYTYINRYESYNKIVSYYLIFVVFYCLLTIVVIFGMPDYYGSLPRRNWAGRLSIGYPTMDVFVLACGLIFVDQLVKRKTYKVMLSSLIVFVIVMQNNVTGFILLLFYSLYYVFFRADVFMKGLSFIVFFFVGIAAKELYQGYDKFGAFGPCFGIKLMASYFRAATTLQLS